MPTELELIALTTEFTLYLPFLKRLVLNLPDCKDRIRAAMWLKKLRAIRDDEQKKLRNEHLKLLLFALHRRSLVGVFEKPPPDELESFHDGLTLLEMTRELIEITEKRAANSSPDSGKSPLPPVTANLSYDLKEYSAAQEIPKFGAHCYYAVSNEPIQMWRKSGNVGIPYPDNAELPSPQLWEMSFAKIDDKVLEKQAALDKQIQIAKMIESGELSEDELEPEIDFKKKIDVPKSQPTPPFKWKKDSVLNIYQTYDFSDVGTAEDLTTQGKEQLELDEDAFKILDQSLPARQRIVVRDPYFVGLPRDLADRRLHGVNEEMAWPDPEEDSAEDEISTEETTSCTCDISNSLVDTVNSKRLSQPWLQNSQQFKSPNYFKRSKQNGLISELRRHKLQEIKRNSTSSKTFDACSFK